MTFVSGKISGRSLLLGKGSGKSEKANRGLGTKPRYPGSYHLFPKDPFVFC
jgi:hypothetical protein